MSATDTALTIPEDLRAATRHFGSGPVEDSVHAGLTHLTEGDAPR